jgi:transcription-repair coupling factor (superfamily II helicase)
MSSTLPDTIGRLVSARPLQDLAKTLAADRALSASGLWGSSVAAVIAAVEQTLHRPMLVICGHLDEVDDLADDIYLFSKEHPAVLPALELAGSLGHMSEELVSNRLGLLSRLTTKNGTPRFLVSSIQALMQPVPSRRQLDQLLLTIAPGQKLEAEKLIVWLSEHGYNRLEQVEVPGDFAVRGGIIDVYIPGEFEISGEEVGLTARIDFFDDQIESIKRFDLDTMGSLQTLESVRVVDLKGALPESSESTSLFRYFPPETIVVWWAPLEIAEQAKSYLDRLNDVKGMYPLSALMHQAEEFTRLELSQFDQGSSAGPSLVGGKAVPHVRVPIRSLQRFETEAKKAIGELAELSETTDITIYCENIGEKARFLEMVESEKPGLAKQVDVQIGYLHRGFVWEAAEGTEARRHGGTKGKDEEIRVSNGTEGALSPEGDTKSDSSSFVPSSLRPLALLGHHELFHRYEQRRRVGKVIASRPVDSFLDLKSGDYVVHVAHGIAKFMGMQIISKDGHSEEYLTLRFAENATLHVPAARINLIQKYVGNFPAIRSLSRLGSGVVGKAEGQGRRSGHGHGRRAAGSAGGARGGTGNGLSARHGMAARIRGGVSLRADAGSGHQPPRRSSRTCRRSGPWTGCSAATSVTAKPRWPCGPRSRRWNSASRSRAGADDSAGRAALSLISGAHGRIIRSSSIPSADSKPPEQKETVKKLAKGEIDLLIGTHRLISKDVKFADLGWSSSTKSSASA